MRQTTRPEFASSNQRPCRYLTIAYRRWGEASTDTWHVWHAIHDHISYPRGLSQRVWSMRSAWTWTAGGQHLTDTFHSHAYTLHRSYSQHSAHSVLLCGFGFLFLAYGIQHYLLALYVDAYIAVINAIRHKTVRRGCCTCWDKVSKWVGEPD